MVDELKTNFKNMLRDVFKHNRARQARYRKLCRDTGALYLGACWDVPNRWNSTFLMFQNALRQRETLQTFHNDIARRGRVELFLD